MKPHQPPRPEVTPVIDATQILPNPRFDGITTTLIIRRSRFFGDLHRATTSLGVPFTMVSEWLVRGTKDDGTPEWPKYREFLLRVEAALAEHEGSLVGAITQVALSGDWKAAAWLLERNNPDKWASAEQKKKRVTSIPGETEASADLWWTNNAPRVHRSIEAAGSSGLTKMVADVKKAAVINTTGESDK